MQRLLIILFINTAVLAGVGAIIALTLEGVNKQQCAERPQTCDSKLAGYRGDTLMCNFICGDAAAELPCSTQKFCVIKSGQDFILEPYKGKKYPGASVGLNICILAIIVSFVSIVLTIGAPSDTLQ